MTRQEFYEKYKDVKFVLSSYNKYTFQFVGDYEGNQVTVCVGGNSNDIYSEDFVVGVIETIATLMPHEGFGVGDDHFYNY